MKYLVLFCILFGCIFNLNAQSAELQEAYSKKTSYLQSGDLAQAIVWGEKMLSYAEKEFGSENVNYAHYAGDLGNLYVSAKEYEKAVLLLSKVLPIYKKEFGEDHQYVGITYQNLGMAYNYLNQKEEALKALNMALKIYTKALGQNHEYTLAVKKIIGQLSSSSAQNESKGLLEIEKSYGKESIEYASALNTEAMLREEKNKGDEAEQFYIKSLELYKKLAGEDENYFTILTNLCSYYIKTNQNAKLLPYLRNGLELAEKLFGKAKQEYENYLINLSEVLLDLKKEREALPYFKERLELKKNRLYFKQDSLDYTIILSNIAEINRINANYQEAAKEFEQCVQWIEILKGKEHTDYLLLCGNLAYTYRQLERFEDAEKLSLQMVELYAQKKEVNYQNYATLLNNLGLLYTAMGLYEKAEYRYKESLDISEKKAGTENEFYASTLSNYGLLLNYMGKFNEGERYLFKSMALKEKLGGRNQTNFANILIDLGNLNTLRGNYVEAEVQYLEAIRIYEEQLGKKHPFYINALNSLALLYVNMYQFEKSQTLYNEIFALYNENNSQNTTAYATSLNNLAVYYLELGDTENALKYFQQSLELREKLLGNHNPDMLESMNNIAVIYEERGEYEKAIGMMKGIISSAESLIGKEHISYSVYLSNLGDLYLEKEDFPNAEKCYEESWNIRKKKLTKNSSLYNEGLSHMAMVYMMNQNFPKADQAFTELNQNYKDIILNLFPALTEKEKANFFLNFKTSFDFFKYYALQRYASSPQIAIDLYNLQILTKALLLNNSSQLKKQILNGNDEDLKKLYSQWLAQKEYLAKLYTLDKEELARRNISLNAEETLASELEKQLNLKSEVYGNSKKEENYTFKDIQKNLQEGEAIVEIMAIDLKRFAIQKDSLVYAALLIQSGSQAYPELITIGNGITMDQKYYKNYFNSIKNRLVDKLSYSIYWKPIKDKLRPGIKKVHLVPDGVYHQISLNTLYNVADERFLLDETEIQLLGNSKDLILQKQLSAISKQGRNPAVLFGFPDYDKYPDLQANLQEGLKDELIDKVLPNMDTLSRFLNFEKLADLEGTRLEVESISKILLENDEQANVYLREKATEEVVKGLKDPYILHIATHGFFLKNSDSKKLLQYGENRNIANPLLRSGLLLVGAKKALGLKNENVEDLREQREDGILTAFEAMNLQLDNTSLVVLSACETGLGDVISGEGVYGLQRAFKVAGARTILMSLWTVNDNATQELMVLFYTNLAKLGDKRAAFLEAQRQLKLKYKEPYYWGAFVLIGE